MSLSSGASGSQSSDGGEKGKTSITFNMHRDVMNRETKFGTFRLEMPSWGTIPNFQPNDKYPQILLQIKDDDQMDSLMRMKQLQHENVLAVHFFDKDEGGDIRAYVEKYTGFISDLLTQPDFFVDQETNMVPSLEFQQIVSQSLEGLDNVIENGLYHGNFSWETTVYNQEKDGAKILKLCNFEVIKNKTLLECQLGDCHALAHSLEKVSQHVQGEYANYKHGSCCLLDDLACRLRAVDNKESLSTMKDCVFFWDDQRKRTFWAYDIPAVWSRPAFLESFQGSPSMPPMNWKTLWKGHVLMNAMEKYRVINKIPPHSEDTNGFLRFISGLYTHQIELDVEVPHQNIDADVLLKHPRLLLDLKKATDDDANANAIDVDNQ